MEAKRFDFGDIFSESRLLFAANAAFLLIVTAIVAAGYVVLDLLVTPEASSLPGLVVGVFVQYLVVERLLADRLQTGGGRRYGAMFVAALLSGLGILLGFVLLVIPGLVLAAGWAAFAGFVVVDRMGGAAALGASWRATRGSRLPIVLVMLVTYVPFLALAGAVTVVIDPEMVDTPAAIVVSDLIVSALSTWGWLLGAAIYRLAVPSGSLIEEVFG